MPGSRAVLHPALYRRTHPRNAASKVFCAAGESASSARRTRTLTYLGFDQDEGVSRVFVRTSGPVRYTVSEEDPRTVVLELEDTRIQVFNNTRALDTSFFDTPVALVDPARGPGRTVRVQIKLKEQVPYEARQEADAKAAGARPAGIMSRRVEKMLTNG